MAVKTNTQVGNWPCRPGNPVSHRGTAAVPIRAAMMMSATTETPPMTRNSVPIVLEGGVSSFCAIVSVPEVMAEDYSDHKHHRRHPAEINFDILQPVRFEHPVLRHPLPMKQLRPIRIRHPQTHA